MNQPTILVATDLSRDARHAGARAARLCKQGVFARGRLLHVIQQTWVDTLRRLIDLPADRAESLLAESRRELLDEAHALEARYGVLFEASVRIGNVDQVIREEAARANVLALGARGRHPTRDFTIGTTAEHLLRWTRTPLLVVRNEAATDYRNVLVATDFSAHARKALELACAIAPQATIHLHHVFEMPFEGMLHFAGIDAERIEEYRRHAHDEAREEMSRFIAASAVDSSRVHATVGSAGHAPSALQSHAREVDADLAVVGKHGKNLTEELLLGSVTLYLLAESACDVLVAQ